MKTKKDRERKGKKKELNKHSEKQFLNEEDQSTKHEDNEKDEPDTKSGKKRIKHMNEEERKAYQRRREEKSRNLHTKKMNEKAEELIS